ncbi:MAG: MFS transporter [Candidatus Adiutrix sp.]|jgi:MFS family permease|nr:MFS transporter [Candidatus Adiutrix sp.]
MEEKKEYYRDGAEERGKAAPLWTLPFLSFVLLNLFIFMGFDILLPTLSLYLENQGHSEAEIGRIFSAFTVAAIITRTLAGRLACHFAAMRLVRVGLLGCAVAGLWYFWAHSVPGGMAVRFLHGASFGLASTLITSLASQIIPPARMGEGMGYLGLGTTLALALGPFFGIWLVDEWGYLFLFVTTGGFYVGAVALVSLLPKLTLASAAPGAPRPKPVLLSRKILAPSLLIFLSGVVMSSVVIFLALFCKEKNLPYVGHFFVFSTIGLFVARFTAGRIHDRLGHQFVIVPAGALMLACMFLLHQADSRDMIIAISIVYGLATGAIFPSLQALTISMVTTAGRTEAMASFFNAFDLGFGFGALALGYLANWSGSYGTVFLGGAAGAALLLLFYIGRYIIWKPKAKAGA